MDCSINIRIGSIERFLGCLVYVLDNVSPFVNFRFRSSFSLLFFLGVKY